MSACMGGVCGRFVSIVVFMLFVVGLSIHRLASCWSPFTRSMLIELEAYALSY